MSRPIRSIVLVAFVVPAVAALTATSAPASAASVTPTSRTITGDVTGDGLADQVTLGSDSGASPHCSARVRVGRAGGGFSGTGYLPLPVRGTTVLLCPDLGVVVAGPTPAKARLAVTFSSVAPLGGKSVQFFRWTAATPGWVYDGGTAGQFQPSSLRTKDVDGDGWGDLVEVTDQGAGVAVFAGRASTYRQVWSSSPSTSDALVFADFDHGGGLDLVDGHSFFSSLHVGVTVVDGATGTTKVLVNDTSDAPSTYTPEAVDLNHDGWLDIRVAVFDADGVKRPAIVFRNKADGTLGFTRL